MAIDITKLSAEERAEFVNQARELDKIEKKTKSEDRKAFKEISTEFVNRNIDFWITHKGATGLAIENLWKEFTPLLELKSNIYGTKALEQESHTSTLPDGSASITIGYNVTIGFDGTESEGVKMIMEVINELSDEDDDNKKKKLAKISETFLKPNAKTGMLNPSKIIELSKLKDDFNDERFNDGLQIIFDAQQKRKNSMFVSGWKFISEDDTPPVKLEFRFTI